MDRTLGILVAIRSSGGKAEYVYSMADTEHPAMCLQAGPPCCVASSFMENIRLNADQIPSQRNPGKPHRR